MRVTNSIITRNSKYRLQEAMSDVDGLREDISSGIKVRKMSDDPINAGQVVQVNSSLRAITQFKRNVDSATSRATAEETVLDQLTNTLARAQEIGVMGSGSTADASTRTALKQEIDQLLDFAAQLGNTRYGDEYIFGGNRKGEAPFITPPPATGTFSALTQAGNPVDPSGSPTIEIGANKFVTPVHNGTELLLSSDVLGSLRAMSDALGANDPTAIQAATTRVSTANSNVQSLVGAQGARLNELSDAKTRLLQMENDLKAYRSDLRDTDTDEAMVDLVSKQTLYQAAMSATSRILGLSLANYI